MEKNKCFLNWQLGKIHCFKPSLFQWKMTCHGPPSGKLRYFSYFLTLPQEEVTYVFVDSVI